MSDNATPHRTDLTDAAESPTTDDLVALAHARRQGILDETREQLLERLPEPVARPGRLGAGRQDGRR